MTYPRAHLVDAENGGFYHCISRCVRRSWLCGEDFVTGRSYEHRREWVESRLLELSTLFAIDVYGYAVMSNHYHCVVSVVPDRIAQWSDEEVARRWCALSPGKTAQETEWQQAALVANAARLAEIRPRLASLSWFMRFINEPVARQANREDGVKGRFWEGRFKSIALLDEGAVAACMAYVDLNPIRAKTTNRVEDASHTSVRRRILEAHNAEELLAPLSDLSLTLADYRSLLEWTVAINGGGVGQPERGACRALSCLRYTPHGWLGGVKAHRLKYRAYGALDLLRRYAESSGQRWLCGAKPGMAAPV